MTKFCHKTATYSLEDFVNQFIEIAELGQIPESYLIRAFKSSVDLETSQHFPTALKDESFNIMLRDALKYFQLLLHFAESIRDLHKLSIKTYKGLPDFQAQFALRLRFKELLVKDNDCGHLHSDNVTRNKLLHRCKGKDSDTTLSSYHKDCRRKQEEKPKSDYTKKIFIQEQPDNIKTEFSADKQCNLAEKVIRKISTLKVNGIDANVHFDTGSDVSFVHHDLVKDLKLKIFPTHESVKGIGGVSTQTSITFIYLLIKNIKHQANVYVSNNNVLKNKVLLGNNFLDRFSDFLINTNYVRLAGEIFYFHKTKVFLMTETHIALTEDLDDTQRYEIISKLIKKRFPCLHSTHLYGIGNCDIDISRKQFLAEKFIPQKHHVFTVINSKNLTKRKTKFVSNYVNVQAQNKEDRFAVDLKAINSASVPDSYPTRTIQEIFQEIRGAKHITTIDATKAFLSLRLHSFDYQYYDVFTPFGIYCFTRMLFGDLNTMAIWQRVCDAIVNETKASAYSYADDMIIIDKLNDIIKHLRDIEDICTVAKQHGLKFNVDKCKFAQTEITILGWITDGFHKRPGHKLTYAMTNRKIPSTIRKLKSFLANAGFFGDAVKNFTARAVSLLNCVRTLKKVKIELNQQQIDSFIDIINALTSPETILFPDFTKEFHV